MLRDSNYDLQYPNDDEWQKQPQSLIDQCLAQVKSDYFIIVDDYLAQANIATKCYQTMSEKHSRWRSRLIIATGLLAALNVCAALELSQVVSVYKLPSQTREVMLAAVLNGVAALYAGALTVFGNLENFFNKGEKAAGFRESRDLLLTQYREYCFKWVNYVEVYGQTGRACMNATRLYRQLVDTDRDLRQKLKQLTEVNPRGAVDAKKTT